MKNIQQYKDRVIPEGHLVEVYRNLHNDLLSIRDAKSKHVLGHANTVHLTGVTFRVSQKGRERVVLTKRKEVHAVVRGNIQHMPESFWIKNEVVYNPYKYEQFTTLFDNRSIFEADAVILTDGGLKVYNIGE